MSHLWGSYYTRQELLRRVGDINQLAAAQPFELSAGSQRGCRGVTLRNAAGLSLAVFTDRGMGIGDLCYQGVPLAFTTAAGMRHPAYAEQGGLGWLRTFGGGFLTPCGLTQVGGPCQDGNEALGLHGRLSNLPAGSLSWGGEWQEDEYVVWVEGSVREAVLFGENLDLRRRIYTTLSANRFWVEDRVQNLGFAPCPHMFLQHINLGFPLVDAGARLELPPRHTLPRDEVARLGLEDCCVFQAPTPGYQEQVFYHELQAGPDGMVAARLVNPAWNAGRGLSVTVRYALAHYPYLVEWKMMGEGAYVVGLEPANCHVEGRCNERQRGTLQTLAPQETRIYRLEIEFGLGG